MKEEIKNIENEEVIETPVVKETAESFKEEAPEAVAVPKKRRSNASIAPEDADVKDVVFTTSNPNIVAIVNEQTGQIKSGTQNGVATITCTAADGTGYHAEGDHTLLQ